MRLLIAAAAALIAAPAVSAAPPPPPRLIVAISVDQFSADLFDEYGPQFTAGFARLGQGAVFRNGYESHAATETCPGHSTIMTGDRPARTGIVANVWTDQSIARTDKRVYCAEDESIPGTSSVDYRVSVKHLEEPTLGDLMKQKWPASRNVAVSGKDRAAVMMSGRSADQRWYWNGKTFVSDLSASPPAVVAAANAAVAKQVATAQAGLTPTPYCASKATPFALPGGIKVGNGNFARAAGDLTGFKYSPELDGATLALAASLIEEMKLGKGAAPDVISISLSATDYIGHAFGPGGQEMCLQLMSLDRDIGDFLRYLDSTGVDYALVLTADHGGLDIPERLAAKGVSDAVRVDPGLTATAVGAEIGARLGLKGPVLLGDVTGDIYIDRSLSEADRARVLKAAVDTFARHDQVELVLPASAVAATPMPTGAPTSWSLAERVRASFDPKRSGDIYVILKKNIMPIAKPAAGYVATHGSPWDYDRRVPIIFWRRPQFPMASAAEAETVDIMTTLAAALGLELAPGSVDGKCLQAFANVTCPAR